MGTHITMTATTDSKSTRDGEQVAQGGSCKKMAQQAGSTRAQNAQLASTIPADSEDEDRRIQPWQSLMEEIEREISLSPPGSDYFPCQNGFFAHSLAG
jgi:hypothetical protein